MRVRILNVSVVADGRVEVRFGWQLGLGIGTWCRSPPYLNTDYDVELETPESLKWNVSISDIESISPSLSHSDGVSIIVC
jgi:hypothetical protein